MLSYDIVQNKPNLLLAMTGLNKTEFDELLLAFDIAWHKQPEKAGRQRRPGGGRKPKLHKRADQLFFILFYLKTYPLQSVLGFLFSLSQAQANEWIHRLSNVLKVALGDVDCLPERSGAQLQVALSNYDTQTFVQDGCERRRQRPKDNMKQRAYYSGKKKAHTLKNHMVTHPESRRVDFLSPTATGKTHDKKLADEAGLHFPSNATLEQDTGFQGYDLDQTVVIQAKKKPRGKELSVGEKFINRCISSGRTIVENIIAGVKRCRIVKEVFRNWKPDFDDLVMELACGLHNFRVARRNPTTTINLLDLYFR